MDTRHSASTEPGPPPIVQASDAIPNELDLVWRVDIASARRSLGNIRWLAMTSAVKHFVGVQEDSAMSQLYSSALHADRVWFAQRPRLALLPLDYVLISEGGAQPMLEPKWEGWSNDELLAHGWQRRSREASAPLARSLPMRIYWQHAALKIFVTPASLQSVTRQVEQGRRDPHLTPPEVGEVSFIFRRPTQLLSGNLELPRWLTVALARLSEIDGSLSMDRHVVKANLRFRLDEAAEVESAMRDLWGLRDLMLEQGASWSWLKQLKMKSEGEYLVLKWQWSTPKVVSWFAAADIGNTPAWALLRPRIPAKPQLDDIVRHDSWVDNGLARHQVRR